MPPHLPLPFPPEKLELGQILALVGRANACLARYDGLLESLVNPDVLLSPLLMKEAELSSRIEGTIATANEVYQRQAGEEFEPEKNADIAEIINYQRTLRSASEEIKDKTISLHMIRQMHGILMQGVRGESKNPGKFRTTQNWIGSKGCEQKDATYVPPAPTKVDELLDGLIDYISNENPEFDPIVQTALMHAQFELIHPFDDGNGRIGRLLIPLYLAQRKCLVGPSLYVSSYLETHRDEYYAALKEISASGDWMGWIRFFIEAIIVQANANLTLVRNVKTLYETKKYELTALLRTDQAIHILDMLFDTPVFRGADVHNRLGIQRQRAAGYIRSLKEAQVITELRPPRGRRAALLYFGDLFDITG
ncbi:MAG: Fic/DOC family N-terminal domain-containing protein [Planctomycetota bacterium]